MASRRWHVGLTLSREGGKKTESKYEHLIKESSCHRAADKALFARMTQSKVIRSKRRKVLYLQRIVCGSALSTARQEMSEKNCETVAVLQNELQHGHFLCIQHSLL